MGYYFEMWIADSKAEVEQYGASCGLAEAWEDTTGRPNHDWLQKQANECGCAVKLVRFPILSREEDGTPRDLMSDNLWIKTPKGARQ